MLKCLEISSNSKTGPMATTYRSGGTNVFGTCPNSCPLKPSAHKGTPSIDQKYLGDVLKAVPRGGHAWTYSHFWDIPKTRSNHCTIINRSTDTVNAAVQSMQEGYPTVYAAPVGDDNFPRKEQGVRFIECPADKHKGTTCNNCGRKGKGKPSAPLCARGNRDYVIVFKAHGSNKGAVGAVKAGGCYGATGHVRAAWNTTMEGIGAAHEESELCAWVKKLPYGSLLRHHVLGDIGYDSSS